MASFVTVKRTDPQFESYIRGTFSQTQRALALESLNVSTDEEIVTFKMIDRPQLGFIKSIILFLQSLRLNRLIGLLPALLFVMTLHLNDEFLIPAEYIISVLFSVIFLSLALTVQHDVQDYLQGYDRIRPDRANFALRQGLFVVRDYDRFIILALLSSLVFLLPLAWQKKEIALAVALIAVIGARYFFAPIKRHQLMSYLIQFLMHGPLLFAGLAYALTSQVTQLEMMASFVWGWMTLWMRHMKDFEFLFHDARSKSFSLIAQLGFDRALKFIESWWLVGIASLAILHYLNKDTFSLWISILVLSTMTFLFFKRLRALKSPMSSEISQIVRFAHFMYLGFVFIWTFICLQNLI